MQNKGKLALSFFSDLSDFYCLIRRISKCHLMKFICSFQNCVHKSWPTDWPRGVGSVYSCRRCQFQSHYHRSKMAACRSPVQTGQPATTTRQKLYKQSGVIDGWTKQQA